MNILQGEIWRVDFTPNIGAEIQKIRPALVVNHDSVGILPLKTVAPFTEWSKQYANYPWIIKFYSNAQNGLSKDSGLDCFQLRNFSINRFIEKIGYVESAELLTAHKIIAKTLNPKYVVTIK